MSKLLHKLAVEKLKCLAVRYKTEETDFSWFTEELFKKAPDVVKYYQEYLEMKKPRATPIDKLPKGIESKESLFFKLKKERLTQRAAAYKSVPTRYFIGNVTEEDVKELEKEYGLNIFESRERRIKARAKYCKLKGNLKSD